MQGCCTVDPAARHDATEAFQRLAGILRKLPMPQNEEHSMERMMRELAITIMPDQQATLSGESKYEL
jgi:hypothetical protein